MNFKYAQIWQYVECLGIELDPVPEFLRGAERVLTLTCRSRQYDARSCVYQFGRYKGYKAYIKESPITLSKGGNGSI